MHIYTQHTVTHTSRYVHTAHCHMHTRHTKIHTHSVWVCMAKSLVVCMIWRVCLSAVCGSRNISTVLYVYICMQCNSNRVCAIIIRMYSILNNLYTVLSIIFTVYSAYSIYCIVHMIYGICSIYSIRCISFTILYIQCI